MKKGMVALLAGGVLMMATSAMATPFSGTLWSSDAAAQNPAAGPPTGTLLGSFTVDRINFDTRAPNNGTDYTTWLQGSTSSNVNNLVWTTTAPSGFISSHTSGTFMQLVGEGYFGANTKVTHDDGFTINMSNASNSYSVNLSTPVPVHTDSLGNAAGVYDFTLNYGAWNGFPETLIADIAPVPEPGTMMLLGAGFLGLAVYGKRRKSA